MGRADNAPMLCSRAGWFALAAALVGCSPALNWRDVRMEDTPLRLQLPCKPDKAEREVSMAGSALPLRMLGCRADGALFAVSHVRASDAAAAPALLDGWKRAVLRHAQAADVVEQTWAPAGAWQLPQSVRIKARAQGDGGQAVALHATWFAAADSAGVHLFHAVVLAPQPQPQAIDAFFASLAAGP